MHWSSLVSAFATEQAGATPSRISPCMYYREVPWDYQGVLMINYYTDDCTRKMKIGTVPSEEMMADLGTRNLGPKQFCSLGDWMTGYIHVATFMGEVE